jgi:hypothetical protein
MTLNNTRTQLEAPSLGDLNVSNKSKHTEYTHMKSPCLTLPYEIGGQVFVKSSTMEGSVTVILPPERQPCPSRSRPATWLHATLLPNVCANAISPCQKWWQIASSSPAQHALMRSPVFFHLGGLGEVWERGFLFLLFPMYSHYVPIGFSTVSLSSQVVPQDVPNCTWVSSPIICPKFNPCI